MAPAGVFGRSRDLFPELPPKPPTKNKHTTKQMETTKETTPPKTTPPKNKMVLPHPKAPPQTTPSPNTPQTIWRLSFPEIALPLPYGPQAHVLPRIWSFVWPLSNRRFRAPPPPIWQPTRPPLPVTLRESKDSLSSRPSP